MTLTPAQLAGILYEFPELCHLKPIVHPVDTPIFKVRVIPYELGVAIKNEDPNEQSFHVELYSIPPARADLWSSLAWKESLTRRLRNVSPTSTDPSPNIHASIRQVELQLSITLNDCYHLAPEYSRECARVLLTSTYSEELIGLLKLSDIMVTQIRKMRELITQAALNNEHNAG